MSASVRSLTKHISKLRSGTRRRGGSRESETDEAESGGGDGGGGGEEEGDGKRRSVMFVDPKEMNAGERSKLLKVR